MTYAKPIIAAAVLAMAFAGWAAAQDRRGDRGNRNGGDRNDGDRGGQTAQGAAASSGDFAAKYGILSEKNIFVRNRPPTRRGTPRNNGSSSRRPEEAMVLTGIALQEGRHVAFIENTASRSTQRVVVGDTVLGGKVAAIDFDGLQFDAEGRQTRIAVGRNFLGAVFTAAAPAGAANGSATTAASGALPTTAPGGDTAGGGAAAGVAPSPDDAGLSAEERMKRNRLRQLGQ